MKIRDIKLKLIKVEMKVERKEGRKDNIFFF